MKSIAIVSAGLRFPGARSLEEFTKVLEEGRDLSSTSGDEKRWQKRSQRPAKEEGYFHDRSYRVRDWREDLPELAELDPLFHLAYGAASEALKGTEISGLAPARMGLILGNIALPTETSSKLASEWLAREWELGDAPSRSPASLRANLAPAAMPALVVAKLLGLEGTTFTLDAACASSLYAFKLACDELSEGRMDLVLAGGLSRPDPLYTQVGFTALEALSKSGVAHPLDSRADGLMVGEGAGIFALKRLEDAERQGDEILAVIRGIGLSNDREGGLMAPSQEGQWRAMQAAYVDAEWDPRTVELLECHATGTALGDMTEVKSLMQIRAGKSPAVLGSVKSNVGHMLTAAGAAGVAKVLTAFKAQKFWPTANFEAAPESWNLDSAGFRILKKAEPWTTTQELRRAAISGFGFGGINAHVLLEDYKKDVSETVVRIKAKRKVAVIRAAEWLDLQGREEVEVGFKQFRIPPKEMKDILPQQVYSLLAMDRLKPILAIERDKTGCFVGVELDPLTSLFATRWQLQDNLPEMDLKSYVPALQANQVMGSLASIVASRCARELQIGGPSFTVSEAEGSGLRALELASRAIARGELSAALVMAIEIGTSHRAKAQLKERYGKLWAQGSDNVSAVFLMDESIARQLQLPVSVVLDDFHDLENAFDLPLTEGAMWIEDIHRNSDWVKSLAHPQKKLVEGHVYKGAAHGLSSLLQIWESTGQRDKRTAFLLRHQKLHHVSWHQLEPLRVERASADQEESYTIPRNDLRLISAEDLFASVAPQGIEAPQPQRAHETKAEPRRSEPETKTERKAKDPGPSQASPGPASTNFSPPRDFVQDLLKREIESIGAHEEYLKFRNEGDTIIANLLSSLRQEGGLRTRAPKDTREPSNDVTDEVYYPSSGEDATQVREPDTSARDAYASPETAARDAYASTQTAKQTTSSVPSSQRRWVKEPYNKTPALYDYDACEEFANGMIGKVFGPAFAEVDTFPTRVRLPAERLLLCHRVMSIGGEAKSLGPGTMVTEHDVFPDAWYLEDGDEYMPTSIAVESGQADLMLSAYLGADFQTRGKAVYRLLDARVAFHSKPPKVGETIRYEIEIKRFFEQGGTLFFNFAFEGYVGTRHVMSMVDGCAGFFSEDALNEGRGVKRSALQLKAHPGKVTGDFQPFVPMAKESYSDQGLEALRHGDYQACFGRDFAGLGSSPKKLPGGDMKLVHRIREIDPRGGRYGLGQILGEADIHPEDWFLTCHFIDDQVMPGTLMFECCLHTLRVFLMRAGWIGDSTQSLLPKPGVWSGLKCRGQVLPTTQTVTYDIEIKEIGYGPDAYVICDALMYADGKPIVDITDMSLEIPGYTKARFETLWQKPQKAVNAPAFTYEDILAFSAGNPSDCFGEVYKVFDQERKIARLPRPPFQFLDSIEWVDGPYMKQNVGTKLLAHYENPEDAWYWALNEDRLPFSVLVEIALQPCGFMAAYMGSALCSTKDLKFRNLSGEAVQSQDIRRGEGRLSIEVSSTKIAKSGDMIIQDYAFRVFNAKGDVYKGTTSFGFFTEEALAAQAGIRGEASWSKLPVTKPYPRTQALPKGQMRMVHEWEHEGDKLYGAKKVDPKEWFFEAHFFEDPVMPGSLGLESLTQVAMAEADRLWPGQNWRVALDTRHSWIYRGQVRKHNKDVRLSLTVKEKNENGLTFDSVLYCDDLAIYKLDSLRLEKV